MDFDLQDAAARSRANRQARADDLRAKIERQAELTAAVERGELGRLPKPDDEARTIWDDVLDAYAAQQENPEPRAPANPGLYAAPTYRGPVRLKPANPDAAFTEEIRRAHRRPRSTKDQVIGGPLPPAGR